MSVRPGIESLLTLTGPVRRGDRVGLIANQASVLADLSHSAVRLNALEGVDLVRIFAPEHGLWGDAQDHATIGDEVDSVTGVPVVSLYGRSVESLRPAPEALDGLDVVVFDLQDIGTRYYTFLATLGYVMEVAGRTAPIVRTYSDVQAGAVLGLIGSSGTLEISVREGCASEVLQVGPGAEVVVRRLA